MLLHEKKNKNKNHNTRTKWNIRFSLHYFKKYKILEKLYKCYFVKNMIIIKLAQSERVKTIFITPFRKHKMSTSYKSYGYYFRHTFTLFHEGLLCFLLFLNI